MEARYTADDKWYKAIILQVIHGGFEIARCSLNNILDNIDTCPNNVWVKRTLFLKAMFFG